MGAGSTFTAESYHCKPLMTDVIVIHITHDVTVIYMTDVTVIHQVNT